MALSIKQKLLVTPALGTLSLLLLMLMTLVFGRKNEAELTRIQSGYAPSVALSHDLVDLLAATQRALQVAVATEDEQGLAEADAKESSFLERLATGSQIPGMDPRRVTSLNKEFADYYQLAREVSGRLIRKEHGEDTPDRQQAMAGQYNAVRARLERNSLEDKRAMATSFERASGYLRTTTWVEALLIFSWIGVAGFLSLVLSRQISGRVTRLRDASVLLGDGKQAPSIEDGEQDELGELALSINQMAKSLSAAQESAEAARVAARLRSVLNASHDAIITVDQRCGVADWNTGAERIFGWSNQEATGRSISSLVGTVPGEWLRTHAATPAGARVERTLKRRSGEPFPAELRFGSLVNQTDQLVIAFCRDLTHDRAMELELRQAQKLESVGRLAAGVAHEINTPVQFISDSLHFLRDASKDLLSVSEKLHTVQEAVRAGTPAVRLAEEAAEAEEDADLPYLVENMPKAFERALDGLNRVSTIVRSMKEFAHPDAKEKTPVDLNRAIESTLTIARNEYKYVADVKTEYGELPRVLCHAGEINQAFLNIIINAAHAIEEVVKGTDKKGLITIRTWSDEKSVVVSISDTGGGIPERIRQRIFDPFFTTKEVGKGTGQGLAISRSVVVDKHKGQLTLETEVGKGTTFFIRLPFAVNEVLAEEKQGAA